jgi:restriction system protein
LVGVGKVTGPARYDPSFAAGTGISGFTYPNVLPVEWQKDFQPRTFKEMVFGIQTLYEVTQQEYGEWVSPVGKDVSFPGAAGTPEQVQEFVFERHLEDFMAKNFDAIFEGKLKLCHDPAQNEPGQQYETGEVGRIDLLAQSMDEKEFVVIELKKGMPSDEVVGQTLRYMGWVKCNLCRNDQSVRGIIISPKKAVARPDPQLEYALKMAPAIEHKLYTIQFSLSSAEWP